MHGDDCSRCLRRVGAQCPLSSEAGASTAVLQPLGACGSHRNLLWSLCPVATITSPRAIVLILLPSATTALLGPFAYPQALERRLPWSPDAQMLPSGPPRTPPAGPLQGRVQSDVQSHLGIIKMYAGLRAILPAWLDRLLAPILI